LAFTEALRLVVDADTRGAVQGVERLGRTAERELSRSEQSLDRWGNRLTTVGAGMIALGSVALVGLGAAAMASEEANLATVKLENTLKNMPALAGESSKQFIDLANSLQDVTAADADAIVEAQALLGTFQLTAQEIKGITPLVVDYARKFGVDLPDAAVQVGKALDGNVGALKRNGVSIDEAAFATDRYAAVQKALSEQVGGFAEAEGATFAGSLQRLKNELGDLAEGVGVGAVDAFSSMFGVVEGLTDRFSQLSPETQSLIGKFATFGSLGLIAAGGLSVVIGQTIKARENFSAAAAALSNFTGGFRGLAITLAKGGVIIAGLVALEAALDAAFGDQADIAGANLGRLEASLLRFGQTGRVTGELTAVAGRDFEKLKSALGDIDLSGVENARASVDRFAASIPGVGRALGTGFADDIDKSKRAVDDFDKALASIAQQDPELAFGILKDAAAALGVSVEDLMPALDDYDATLGGVAAAAEHAGVPVNEFGVALDSSAASAEAAKVAIQEYSAALNGTFDPIVGFMNAQDSSREALDNLRTAELNVIAAVQQHGATSVEAATAQEAYNDAQRTALGATVDLDAAAFELNEMIQTQGISLSEARSRLFNMAIQSGFTRAEALALAAQLGQTATEAGRLGSTDPNVDISATDRATPTIRSVDTELENLDGQSATVTIKQLFTSVGQAFGFASGRAVGGPVVAGQAYIVGEKGPELLVPDKPGWVIPNDQYGQMASAGAWGGGGMGGGGSTTVVNYHLSFNGPTNDTQVVEALQRYERNNGSGWRN